MSGVHHHFPIVQIPTGQLRLYHPGPHHPRTTIIKGRVEFGPQTLPHHGRQDKEIVIDNTQLTKACALPA